MGFIHFDLSLALPFQGVYLRDAYMDVGNRAKQEQLPIGLGRGEY